jgi:methylenetetrahydrofolate dehydrogenase (NADP+)/methenyltetrahydrofolate cyclohydrolase
MILLDGNKTASGLKSEIAEEVKIISEKGSKIPHLAAVLVGHDGGSETYVAFKIKDCEEVGFKSSLIRFEDDVTEEELLKKVDELNNDSDVDGFIVQLPLPDHISEQKVIEAISPQKDVDGFHPVNVGRMVIGLPSFVSATPFGIVELLKKYNIETSGKNCVVIGRSNIVGRPLSVLLSQKSINATVTVAHSRTKNLKELCASADILIAAEEVRMEIKG